MVPNWGNQPVLNEEILQFSPPAAEGGFNLIASARAQEGLSEQSANTNSSAELTSRIPANTQPPTVPSAAAEQQPSESARAFQEQFLILIALSIVLGLLAQALSNEYDATQTFQWKPIGRQFTRSLVIAPIVLLAFITTADLNAIGDWKQSLVLCLLAFQAGYFWKAVLEKAKGAPLGSTDSEQGQPGKSTAQSAVAPVQSK